MKLQIIKAISICNITDICTKYGYADQLDEGGLYNLICPYSGKEATEDTVLALAIEIAEYTTFIFDRLRNVPEEEKVLSRQRGYIKKLLRIINHIYENGCVTETVLLAEDGDYMV